MTADDGHTCKTCDTPLPSPTSACPGCATAFVANPDQRAETKPVAPPIELDPNAPTPRIHVDPNAPTLTPSPLPFPAPHEAPTPSPLPFPSPDSNTDLLVGMSFGGCSLEEKIGQGGMGAVYRAHHQALDRKVVVKILPPASTSVPEFRTRFVREAQAAARLSHPNVVHVYDVGDERGLLFYVMELIEGESLDDVCQRGALRPRRAVTLIREAAKGLGAAHEAGIIHRDVKAANILLCSKGEVKVTDFGVACDLTKERLSGSGMLLGTPAYMAPEQAEGKGDARSDLYSLGVTLFQLLTSKLPFEGDTFMRVLNQHKSAPPPSPAKLVPGTPSSVCTVVEKLLKKDPAQRYQDVDALVADLDAVLLDLEGTRPFPEPRQSALPLVIGLLGVGALIASWQWGRVPQPTGELGITPVASRTDSNNGSGTGPSMGPAPDDPEPTLGRPLTLSVDTPPGGLIFKTSTVRFTASLDGDVPADLELLANGEKVVAVGRLSSITVRGLAEGDHVVRLSARSAGAEVAALGVAVRVDTTPPSLTLVEPSPGQAVRVEQLDASRSLSVSVRTSDTAPLRVRARLLLPKASKPSLLTPSDGGYSGDVSLRPAGQAARTFVGSVTLVVEASDRAGNVAESRVELTLVPSGMVLVPKGEFRTGSNAAGFNSPLRFVTAEESRAFFIDAHEVTNARYQEWVDAQAGAAPRSPAWDGGHYRDGFADHPVQGVSYVQAVAFAAWGGGRLPTELEWEKAASWSEGAKRNTRYPWGPSMQPETANTRDYWSSRSGQTPHPTPVGSFRQDKSPYGCYDMGGNVQEWATQTDPGAAKQVLKGGCYLNRQAAATCARREERSASATLEQVGFRCVRDLSPGDEPDR